MYVCIDACMHVCMFAGMYVCQTKVLLVASSYCKPFPLESVCQHDSSQISPREYLLSLLNRKPDDNLTVAHLPRKMDMKNRSGTDSKT